MKIPKNYDPNVASGWTPITAGGHKCVIKQVESEGTDRFGQKALVISFDTSEEDTQPKYFSNQYLNSPQERKEWRGVKTYSIDGNDNFDSQLSKFLSAVQASNDGVSFEGNQEVDDKAFKNLKVGVVFRLKRYTKPDHSVGVTMEPYYFCSYDKAFEQKVPAENDKTKQAPTEPDYGFVNVPADALENEGLPFA